MAENTSIDLRHIGNDMATQAETLLKMLHLLGSSLAFNDREDRFYLATVMDPPLREREVAMLESARNTAKHASPEFRQALKDAITGRGK